MLPHLDSLPTSIPCGAAVLQNGYVLLPKRNSHPMQVTDQEVEAIAAYVQQPMYRKVRRWGCLCLPNGQIARSKYTELQRPQEEVRMARNVKV